MFLQWGNTGEDPEEPRALDWGLHFAMLGTCKNNQDIIDKLFICTGHGIKAKINSFKELTGLLER